MLHRGSIFLIAVGCVFAWQRHYRWSKYFQAAERDTQLANWVERVEHQQGLRSDQPAHMHGKTWHPPHVE